MVIRDTHTHTLTHTHSTPDSHHPAMLGDGDTTHTHSTLDSHHPAMLGDGDTAHTHTQQEGQPFRPTSAPPSRCLEKVQIKVNEADLTFYSYEDS